MQRLRDRIAYRHEDMRDGGRIRISTRHARALAAVHEFLRFQITEHKTGDSLEVTRSSLTETPAKYHAGTRCLIRIGSSTRLQFELEGVLAATDE